MGSVTVSRDHVTTFGDKEVSYGTITMSSSYASNGDSYTISDFGFTKLDRLMVFPADGWVPDVDKSNSKIMVKGMNPTSTSSGVIALEEETAAVNLSSVIFPYIAIGN